MGSRKTIEVEVDLDEYSDSELIEELEERDYEFIDEVEESEMVEYLIDVGYTVFKEDEQEEKSLDYKDGVMLDEIIKKFHNSSWSQREEIHKNATKQ